MDQDLRGRLRLVLLGAAIGAALAGCRAEPKGGVERYIPPSEAARAGVVRAMEGWLAGLSPEASGSTKPMVHVVDQTRRADQRLARYEILGEMPAENARSFAVRVTYVGADGPEVVRFFVVGVDPMWVFRQEDYETIWMHEDAPPTDRVAGPARKP